MSDPFDDRKKRPPPIIIPAVPRITATTQATRTNTDEQEQENEQQRQLSLSEQGSRFSSSPLTFPPVHDHARIPLPKSDSQKSRKSAIANLAGLIEEARRPTQELELVGIGGPTTRSNTSSSRQRANSGQAKFGLYPKVEKTTRAWIESRTEQHVFDLAGQIPPQHLVGE